MVFVNKGAALGEAVFKEPKRCLKSVDIIVIYYHTEISSIFLKIFLFVS